jgi:uncharacterized protein (DUF2235 family)
MKRLIVCCDGTWNSLKMAWPTNVVLLSEACKPVATDGTHQVLHYDAGIGTDGGLKDKWFGGAFGWGIDKNIQDAYRFLCLNYEDGDEVYLFGFSRGAYTVRSLAGMIYCCGLLPRHRVRETIEAYQFYRDNTKVWPDDAKAFQQQHQSEPIDITLLGCWDTVGSLGIPRVLSTLPHQRYRFHDTKLNRKIQHALHAVAIDERRKPFNVTPMNLSEGATTTIKEVWFPGHHGCVGGGTESIKGLSNAALHWMVEAIQALGLGLEFEASRLAALTTDPMTPIHSNLGIYGLLGAIDRAIPGREDVDMSTPEVLQDILHASAIDRYRTDNSYRPKNLSIHPWQAWLSTLP